MRLLSVNIYFDPDSFGGATIIAEHMAQELDAKPGFDMTAVSARFAHVPAASVVRYRTKHGFDGYSIGLPFAVRDHDTKRYANPMFDHALRSILETLKPDAVHVHCVQEIGASFFDVLCEMHIPFAVTVHDFWWLCARQFMIDSKGHYCNQTRINYARCAETCGELGFISQRGEYLARQLNKADLILTPSGFAREMLTANGINAEKIVVNGNGITMPGPAYPQLRKDYSSEKICFGYIGGPGPIKGWDIIRAAFADVRFEDAKVIAVDAGELIGQSWRNDLEQGWSGAELKILPGYTSDTLDEMFARFDVLLAPARWKETFGLAVREAIVRGIWVIASDAGGLSEDIVDGQNGRIIPFPPDAQSLRKAIHERLSADRAPFRNGQKINTIGDQALQLAGLLEAMVMQNNSPGPALRKSQGDLL